MKNWSDFLKDVIVHVPGCPEPVAEHAVLRAAQEFMEATRVWKLWLTDMATEVDQTEYSLFLEPKSELVRLERATLDGRQILVRSEDALTADWKTYPQCLATGVHTTDGETLVLLPPQCADLTLLVEASLKPSNDATGVQDDIFDRFVVQIASGAVAALKAHVAKTYSDPNGALMWRAQFNAHMSGTDFRRFRGYSSARPRRRIQTF